jgi:cytochrome c oxidase cbb3-type subunit 2
MDHGKIEKNIVLLIVLIIVVTSIGAMVEIFPLFKKEVAIEQVEGMRPYTPLELAGFEIYKREGCYGCHSQQVRTLVDEVERYGHYSLAAESMYDYPFMWGSKRTGPDLARVGGKYSDDWHVRHLINPRSLVPESIMPGYPYLAKELLDYSSIKRKMELLRMLGVPYQDEHIENYEQDIKIQLSLESDPQQIEAFNKRYPKTLIGDFGKDNEKISEMDAIVAYLQGLGNKADLNTNKGIIW